MHFTMTHTLEDGKREREKVSEAAVCIYSSK